MGLYGPHPVGTPPHPPPHPHPAGTQPRPGGVTCYRARPRPGRCACAARVCIGTKRRSPACPDTVAPNGAGRWPGPRADPRLGPRAAAGKRWCACAPRSRWAWFLYNDRHHSQLARPSPPLRRCRARAGPGRCAGTARLCTVIKRVLPPALPQFPCAGRDGACASARRQPTWAPSGSEKRPHARAPARCGEPVLF